MLLNLTKNLDVHRVSVIRNTSKYLEAEPKAPEVKTASVPGPKGKELFSKLKLFQNVEDIELFTNYSKSKGNYLVDADGNTFLDVNMQGSRLPLGYNYKELEKVLPDCLISPKIPNVCICPCDSSAVEQGMKSMMISYKKYERGKIVDKKTLKSALLNQPPGSPPISILSFTNSLHGSTLGALNVTHFNPWLKLDVPSFDWPIAVYPEYRYPLMENVGYNDYQDSKALTMVEDLIVKWDKKGIPVAGIIIESIQCATNNVASAHFYQKLEELSYKYGLYFMLDETKTCCGITGRFWAHEHFCLKCPPDLVSFGGKAQISGFMHSENLNPKAKDRLVNLSAGSATKLFLFEEIIKQIEQHNLLHNVRTTGDALLSGLIDMSNRYDGLIHSIRGLGLYLAFDVQCTNLRDDFVQKLRRRGILCGQCGNSGITLRPALIFTKTHACILLDKLEQLLKETELIEPKDPTTEVRKAARCVKKKFICEKAKEKISKAKCPKVSKKETCPAERTENVPPKKCLKPKICSLPKDTDLKSKPGDSNCLKEIKYVSKCTKSKTKSLCPQENLESKRCKARSDTQLTSSRSDTRGKECNDQRKSSNNECMKESKSSNHLKPRKKICEGKSNIKTIKCGKKRSKNMIESVKKEAKTSCKEKREDKASTCNQHKSECNKQQRVKSKKSICEGKQNIRKLQCGKKCSEDENKIPKSSKGKCTRKENKLKVQKLKCNKQQSVKSKKSLCEGKQNVSKLKSEEICSDDEKKLPKRSKTKCKKGVNKLNSKEQKHDCSKKQSESCITKQKPVSESREKINEGKCIKEKSECKKNQRKSLISTKKSVCKEEKNIKTFDCNDSLKKAKDHPKKREEIPKKSICEGKQKIKNIDCSKTKIECENESKSEPKRCAKLSPVVPKTSSEPSTSSKKTKKLEKTSSWMEQNKKCKKVIKKRKKCDPPKRKFSTCASCPNLT
ncbi:uncharacterized protein LOC130895719 isoform X2 [Diorhabda carinulata]|uniref:uncharacterized protein LOC130895719 isoform X2 n=1 Tax=Diorhabda carinulata TaxID=1163345 RepID=UPI0025A1EB5A|nr:uncharacterized protein LOC130895719 isoform X2 [Diorhabda carinulata]